MIRKSNSDVKSLQEENESLKKEIESLKNEFGRISSALKSHESSCGGHKPHPEMETSLEFVGAEYEELKGLHVAAKKDLKALGERLNFLSDRVHEMAIEIDNLIQHSYSFNANLVGVPEIAESGSKEPAIDTTKLCVRIFQTMGCNISINDIDIAHRVPTRNATSGPKPIICSFVRRLTREEVMSRRREISRVHPKDVGLGDAAELSNSMVLDHLTPKVQELLAEAKKFKIQHKYAFCWVKSSVVYLRHYRGQPCHQSERP
ncbi:uncharacterized protein [Montipora capricornis]|uniref:uncharacterized protein n=1 Tax=Montipora capricornis TaxID=246305 RepID=UPI0035F11782